MEFSTLPRVDFGGERFPGDILQRVTMLVPRMRLASLCISALLASLLTGRAGADESGRILSVSYSAPGACGDRERLAELFESRVPERDIRFDSQAAVQFRFERHSTKIRAELRILLEEGGELTRSIEAEDCTAAVEAIAFVAAVALDPGAEDPLQIRKKSEPEIVEETHEANEEVDHIPVARHWTIMASARADYGPAPDFLWGGSLALENASGKSGFWAPSIRVGLNYARRGGFIEEAGTARFELSTVSLDVCPSQALSEIVRMQICGATEGGILQARGLETHAPSRSLRPWVGVGATIASDVRLGGPVWLSYRGTGVFPFVRDAFQFDRAVFHQVPPFTINLQAGLSVRF